MGISTHRVSVHAMYYKIACERAALYHERDAELSKLEVSPVGEEELSRVQRRMAECYEEWEQCAVVAITFAGMALEAFFYDYAAERLGDSFVRDHLDKLDLKSKFLVYPQLVCGKRPDKSKAAYDSLSQLVKLRNDLVHFKSKQFAMDQLHKAANFHSELKKRLKDGVDNAVKCVMLVMDELDRLHGAGSFFRLRMKWSVDA